VNKTRNNFKNYFYFLPSSLEETTPKKMHYSVGELLRQIEIRTLIGLHTPIMSVPSTILDNIYYSNPSIIPPKTTTKEEEMIELRQIPKEQAKELIYEYIKKNPGCWTSDIIIDLQLDPDLVLKVLEELKNEGKIE